MKWPIILIALILLAVVAGNSQADYTPPQTAEFLIPDWSKPNQYAYGGTHSILPFSGGSVITNCFIEDYDHCKEGFGYTFLNLTGKTREPFPDCYSSGWHGYNNIWYENSFNLGYIKFPSSELPPCNKHEAMMKGTYRSRSSIGQWYLQTNPTWAGNPYGRNGCSTIRAYGCCACCAAMQLSANGWGATPATLVSAMMQYKDGFVGKSGLQLNWTRLQKIYGCGYRRGVEIQEALQRGMTVQAGVRHNSDGVAGHWVRPYMFANGPGSYLIDDPMGRGIIDTEIGRYGDGRDNGCWESDTRLLYKKNYDPKSVFGQQSAGSSTTSAQLPSAQAIQQYSTVDCLGRVAPMLEVDPNSMNTGNTAEVTSLGAGSLPVGSLSSLTSASNPAEPSALVDWETSGYTAWVKTGDAHLALTSGGIVVASEQTELIENQLDETTVEDVTLETTGLPSGTYTLEITGAPGTYFEVQTYEYVVGNDEPIDRTISGTIGADGVYSETIIHNSPVILLDLAGANEIQEGGAFVAFNANITTKLASGEFSVQSAKSLLPWKMTFTGSPTTTINNFSQYTLRGTVGPSRTLAVNSVTKTLASDGRTQLPANCKPVARNIRQMFDPVAGCIYTKIAGKVELKAASYFILDGVVVKMTPPFTLTVGQAVTVCGVADGNTFIANPSTLTVMK